MLSHTSADKLAQRVGHLLATDEQFAAALPSREVCESLVDSTRGLADTIRVVAEGYCDRPALARCAPATTLPSGAPPERTVTYGQLWQRVTQLAAVLADRGVHAGAGDRVATLGFSSVDYTIVDLAIPLAGGVSVPLHAGSPVPLLATMVEETEPAVIACSFEYLSDAIELALIGPSPSLMLVFDPPSDAGACCRALEVARQRLHAEGAAIAVETLDDAIEQGGSMAAPGVPLSDGDRLAAVIYTSGSSGSPKGAMHSDRLAVSAWTNTAMMLVNRGFALPSITLNYLPMSHTGGRAMLYSTLGAGGTAYFTTRSDMSTVLEDLALVRPTQLNFVPRIWEMIYQEFLSSVATRSAGGDPGALEEQVLEDLRSRVLGGRYITALTGSAPISAVLARWVERLLDGHLINALGATESGPVIIDGVVQSPPVTDYRIVDVPELGYFATDNPHPRGELVIKSTALFSGYYRRPELTAEVFDDDGFYRTGDIVADLGTDGLRYVDRRNNVVKLSQGEFVTVSRLESIYTNCRSIHQIFVYGSGEHAFLVAVVVPTREAMAACRADDLKAFLLADLHETARAAGLQSYEIPRDIIVERDSFSQANGLLSGIAKPSRPKLRQKYGPRLEQLYTDMKRAQRDRWRELRARRRHQPVIRTVCAAAGTCLHATAEPGPTEHFTELGGDSLTALTFAKSLADIFDLDVPVHLIISPAGDLRSVADFIESQQRHCPARPTFASVHGDKAQRVHAAELTLDEFIELAVLGDAPNLPLPSRSVRTVLLTGATGYLGRYLALQWLQRMRIVDGTVICLVRGRDDATARARLDSAFDSGDQDLLCRYRALAEDRLVVVAGDKSALRLGLAEATWARLAETVDLIVDPAALVNHMLPYPQLFDSNVVGTAELIRLALTHHQKPIVHVSSIGVGATVPVGRFTERADIREISPSRALDDGYAGGYATSKWAAEVLLREAHDLCQLPVTVCRCDMIMAEPGYRGQLNLPDMVTRLIFSLAATGLAPESFFRLPPDGGRARSHFDGLPVDFVAEAISVLSLGQDGFQTYHVINPHDDGVGLDEYVDWLVGAGVRIERIADYDSWFQRFVSALRNMPDAKRHASLLPMIDIYRYPQPAAAGAFAPADHFEAAVRRAGLGAIPHITSAVIAKYVSDLRLLGLLDDEQSRNI